MVKLVMLSPKIHNKTAYLSDRKLVKADFDLLCQNTESPGIV